MFMYVSKAWTDAHKMVITSSISCDPQYKQ